MRAVTVRATGDRHLLTDHAAHRDLERVDGARGASPRRLGDERLETGSSPSTASTAIGSASRSRSRRSR
jgi:hypothetical protein